MERAMSAFNQGTSAVHPLLAALAGRGLTAEWVREPGVGGERLSLQWQIGANDNATYSLGGEASAKRAG
jgi:hypothetical protein